MMPSLDGSDLEKQDKQEALKVDFEKINKEIEKTLAENAHLKYKDGTVNEGTMRDLLTNAFVKAFKERGIQPAREEIATELDYYIIEHDPFGLSKSKDDKFSEERAFKADTLTIDKRTFSRSSIAESTIDQIFEDLK